MEDLDEHMKLAGALGLDWTEDDMVAFSKEVFGAEGDSRVSPKKSWSRFPVES